MKRNRHTPLACFDDKENIWLFDYFINALFVKRYDTVEVEYVSTVEYEKVECQQLYNEIIYYNDKLVLIPYIATNIAVYDIKKEKFRYIMIQNKRFQKINFWYNMIRFGEQKLVLFPSRGESYEYILFDMDTEEAEIRDFSSGNYSLLMDKRQLVLGKGVSHGDDIHLVLCGTNKYLSFNLDNNNVLISESNIDCKFEDMVSIEGLDYFLCSGGTVLAQTIKEENKKVLDIGYNKCEFTIDFVCDNQIVCLPKSKGPIVFINPNQAFQIELEWEKLEITEQDFLGKCLLSKNFFYIVPFAIDKLIKINKNNHQTVYLPFAETETQIRRRMDDFWKKHQDINMYTENTCPIEIFLEHITKQ